MNAQEFVETYLPKISYVVNDVNVTSLKTEFVKLVTKKNSVVTDDDANFFFFNSDDIVRTAFEKINNGK